MQHIKTNLLTFFQGNELMLDLATQVNIIYYKYKAYDTEPSDPANVLCDVSENLVNFIHRAFSQAFPQYPYQSPNEDAYMVYDALDHFISEHCPLEFHTSPTDPTRPPFRNI